jgi:uncharacterized membrane protein
MSFAGISASGAIAAGTLRTPEYWEPIPWRPMTWSGPGAALDDRHPGAGSSLFRALARDGSAAVGAASNAANIINSTIWRAGDAEPQFLAGLPADEWHEAGAISADGAFVAGVFYQDLYIWHEGAYERSPAITGTAFVLASGVTDDGRRVVGSRGYEIAEGYAYEAIIWDGVHGTRRLKDALVNEHGLDLTGWTLTRAGAMTPDGRVVVGWGVNPSGERQAWRAVMPPVPAACDADANQDGNVDQDDVDYVINAVGGGPNPTGFELDFDGDGNVDQGDVTALLNVVAGGACP